MDATRARLEPSAASLRFIALALALLVFLALGRVVDVDVQALRAALGGIPPLVAGAAFVALYVGITTVAWIGPKDVLRVLAGGLFGVALATALVSLAEIANAAVSFGASRALGRDFVARRVGERMDRVDAIVREGRSGTLFCLRLFPVLPFRLLDLTIGLTRVSAVRYLAICAVATPPRIWAVQYVLGVGLDVVLAPERLAGVVATDPLIPVIAAFQLVGFAVVPWILARAGRSVRREVAA